MADKREGEFFVGLDVLPHLTKGWYRKEGTTDAYMIIEGSIIHWDMLNKEQKHDNSLPFAVLAQGTFVYQYYSEAKEYKHVKAKYCDWIMEQTDLSGVMTAGKKLVIVEHEETRMMDIPMLDDGNYKPVSVDDLLYELHQLDLEDIQRILKEATFWVGI
ncbi:hypothetical protein SMUDGE_151 [Bacillus phage Smudge]|uniref:Uncharacterized protein n=1 Tax=Bacillus phage Smudge TaxID=1852566 RepID=A0A173H2T2_9CAUD|nr:hypothetical protein SMUDGE_151 [Bacillus phage Smudge]AOZ61778.1 hypothetical protein BJ4_155 [Bacillus phage BJ4]